MKRYLKTVEKASEASFAKGRLSSKKVRLFVSEFKNLPLPQAIECLSYYLKLLKKKIQSGVLYIESSNSLTPTQKRSIEESFSRLYPITDTKVVVNPSLLVGLSIKLSDMIYKDTLETRLRQLKEAVSG